MKYNVDNPGDCRVSEGEDDMTNPCKLITLDDLLDEKGISSQEVDFIWLDTQGYEMKALFGGRKLLESKRIPLFMEFNPTCYSENDLDEWIKMMKKQYTHYIHIDSDLNLDNPVECDLEQIYELAKEVKKQDRPLPGTDIFLF